MRFVFIQGFWTKRRRCRLSNTLTTKVRGAAERKKRCLLTRITIALQIISLNFIQFQGINFWDTANVYSNGVSEEILGKAIKKYNLDRDRLVIATKVYNPVYEGKQPRLRLGSGVPQQLDQVNRGGPGGLSRKAIFTEVDASLRRMGVDSIDLYQIHRWDYETPIEETMNALHDLVRIGKVRYLGASSMWAHQFQQAQYVAKMNGWTPFVSMQSWFRGLARRAAIAEADRFDGRRVSQICTI